MVNFASVKDGVVLNVEVFATEEDGQSFDYESIYGPGTYGVMLPDGAQVSPGYSYEDGKFKAPPPPELTHDELVQQAELERQVRIAQATAIFTTWQTKLLLNRATEEEKASLNDWVDYVDDIQSVDTQQAPDITWPEQPPIPEGGQ